MKSTEYYLNILKEYKNKYSNAYGIKKIGLFGSVARGEQKENSDIDVYIESDTINLLTMGGIVYDLKELFNADVDLVRNSPKINPYFLKQIHKDIIYV